MIKSQMASLQVRTFSEIRNMQDVSTEQESMPQGASAPHASIQGGPKKNNPLGKSQ